MALPSIGRHFHARPTARRQRRVGTHPIPALAFHLSNVVYHAAGTCLLFLFLRRTTGKTYPSFLAALLWAVHPLRVKSVAWVTERKDVLSGLFGFLALYLYLALGAAPVAGALARLRAPPSSPASWPNR